MLKSVLTVGHKKIVIYIIILIQKWLVISPEVVGSELEGEIKEIYKKLIKVLCTAKGRKT
jgi:hypothetical protein